MRLRLVLFLTLLFSCGCQLFCSDKELRPAFLDDKFRPKEAEADAEWVTKKMVYYLKKEEFREAYALMSSKTRNKWGYWKARVGLFIWTLPGTDVKLPELIATSDTLGYDTYKEKDKKPIEIIWILELSLPADAGGGTRLFNLLMIKDEQDSGRWRLGLRDQELNGPPIPGE
jgi:hypothetical protein